VTDLVPYDPEPQNQALVRGLREILKRLYQELVGRERSFLPPSDPPTVIDVEFEINPLPPVPPSRTSYPFNWEMTPDELRQIRKWKGLNDEPK